MKDPFLGRHDGRACGKFHRALDDPGGGRHKIRLVEHPLVALRVGEHVGLGVAHLEPGQFPGAELFVNHTGPLPNDEILPARLLGNPACQVAIRSKDQGGVPHGLHHLHRVGRGADQVAHGLHFSRGVDIGQHFRPGMLAHKLAEGVRGAAIGQGATRVQVGYHHRATGVEDRRGLGHEMHTAKNNHVAIRRLGSPCQGEGIAHDIGQILDRILLIVVSQDQRVALALEIEDCRFEIDGEF